jgi:hypothetical protein
MTDPDVAEAVRLSPNLTLATKLRFSELIVKPMIENCEKIVKRYCTLVLKLFPGAIATQPAAKYTGMSKERTPAETKQMWIARYVKYDALGLCEDVTSYMEETDDKDEQVECAKSHVMSLLGSHDAPERYGNTHAAGNNGGGQHQTRQEVAVIVRGFLLLGWTKESFCQLFNVHFVCERQINVATLSQWLEACGQAPAQERARFCTGSLDQAMARAVTDQQTAAAVAAAEYRTKVAPGGDAEYWRKTTHGCWNSVKSERGIARAKAWIAEEAKKPMLPEYNSDNPQHNADIMGGARIYIDAWRASSGQYQITVDSIPKFGYKEQAAQQEGNRLIRRARKSAAERERRKKQKQQKQSGAEGAQGKVRVG